MTQGAQDHASSRISLTDTPMAVMAMDEWLADRLDALADEESTVHELSPEDRADVQPLQRGPLSGLLIVGRSGIEPLTSCLSSNRH